MKPGGGVNSLGKFGASAESSKLLLGRLEGVYLFNILPPACRVQWHVISTGWEPIPSPLPVVSSLEHCSVIMFHPELAKRRGKKPEKVFGTGLRAVLATILGHPRLIAEWQQADRLRRLQERFVLDYHQWFIYRVSGFCVCVFVVCFFYSPLRKCQINKQFAPPHPVHTIFERSENLGAGAGFHKDSSFVTAKGHYSVLSKSGSSIFFFLRGYCFLLS